MKSVKRSWMSKSSADDSLNRVHKLTQSFDRLEVLFKSIQLSLGSFKANILNEYRYFARGLVDFHKANSAQSKAEALSRAEVALSSATVDTVDFVVDAVKKATNAILQKHWNARVYEILEKNNYLQVLDSLDAADRVIADARRERHDRLARYIALAESDTFLPLTDFLRRLPAIEFECELDRKPRAVQQRQNVASIKRALVNSSRDSKEPFFAVRFQPKFFVDSIGMVSTPVLAGAEALVRLHLPDMVLGPDEFLELVYKLHLEEEMTMVVLGEVIARLKEWRQEGILPDAFDVAVNVPPSVIAKEAFARKFRDRVATARLEESISIELTEDWQDVPGRLAEINHALVNLPEETTIAIDDFGTGSTRISYLAQFHGINALKIDKSLIDAITAKKAGPSTMLVKGIVGLAQANNFKVIAEGVESMRQLKLLSQLGVKYFQGFADVLGKPEMSDDFRKRLLALSKA